MGGFAPKVPADHEVGRMIIKSAARRRAPLRASVDGWPSGDRYACSRFRGNGWRAMRDLLR